MIYSFFKRMLSLMNTNAMCITLHQRVTSAYSTILLVKNLLRYRVVRKVDLNEVNLHISKGFSSQ